MTSHATSFQIVLAIATAVSAAVATKGACEETHPKSEEPPPRINSWEVIEHEGLKYVTAENIATFYDFHSYTKDEETLSASLLHPRGSFNLNSDGKHSEVTIRKTRFRLIEETLWDNETKQLLVCTYDLSRIIEPVLRPSKTYRRDDDTPILFTFKGDEDLIKKIDKAKLIQSVESRGLEILRNDEDREATRITLVFERQSDSEKPDTVSTKWFWKKERAKQASALSIGLAVALQSHLVFTKKLEDACVIPKEIEADSPFPASAVVVFSVKDSFDSFFDVRLKIATALEKEAKANKSRIVDEFTRP